MVCDLILLRAEFWLLLVLALVASAVGGFAIGCMHMAMKQTERQLRQDARQAGN